MFGSVGVHCWVNHSTKQLFGWIGQSDYFWPLTKIERVETLKELGSTTKSGTSGNSAKTCHFVTVVVCPSAKRSLILGANTRRVENISWAKLY
jgi:hypothetical protein